MQSVADEFLSAMVAKGKENGLSIVQRIVCLSSLHRFGRVLDIFWEEHISSVLIPEFGDPEQLMLGQSKILRLSTAATVMELTENFITFIGQELEAAFLSTLKSRLSGAPSGAFALQNVSEAVRELTGTVHYASHIVDDALHPDMMRVIARGLGRSFAQFALSFAQTPMPPDRKQQLQDTIAQIEAMLRETAMEEAEIFRLTHAMKMLITLLGRTSKELIESFGASAGSTERERVDPSAQKGKGSDKVCQKLFLTGNCIIDQNKKNASESL